MIERALIIDTSSMIGLCAVAQREGKGTWKVLTEKYINAESSHSELLFMNIQNELAENGLKITDINTIVYCAGPGSFTGLRISYSAVKAFALAQNINTVGVSTLRAMMYNLKDSPLKNRAVLIKGSASDVFAFIQDDTGKIILEEGSYDISKVIEIISDMDENDVVCIGSGARFYLSLPEDKDIDRVRSLGMLSLLEDYPIDGINYLKASYAEKRRES